jgi:predicted PurR-regulated permease PerM
VTEPPGRPAAERTGIGDALTTTLRQPSFLRVMLVLAATVVVLVGLRLAAPILNPIFFAVVLTLLFSPVYSWLKRHRIPTPLALIIMLVILTITFVGLYFVLGVSIARFGAGLGSYKDQLNEQLASIEALVNRSGLSDVDVRDV